MTAQSTKTTHLTVTAGVSVTAKVDAPADMRAGTPGLLLAQLLTPDRFLRMPSGGRTTGSPALLARALISNSQL
jgi:hypothetical protein